MNNNNLSTQLTQDNKTLFEAAQEKSDRYYRLRNYAAWLDENGYIWYKPELELYRDHLIATGKSAATIKSYLATIRSRYSTIRRSNKFRDDLFRLVESQYPDSGFMFHQSLVEEILVRIDNAMTFDESVVIEKRDHADSDHLRLTAQQVQQLIRKPSLDDLKTLRDTAIIALMVCTGIRESELCAIQVDDLRQEMSGKLSLRVRRGKGATQRLIPYGELDWCLVLVDAWLQRSGIQSGFVFRGFYKGNKRLRNKPITRRRLIYLLEEYPIAIRGKLTTVKPHDLRRTYASLCYAAGMDIIGIRDNLGHKDIQTTQRYIGAADIDDRITPEIIASPYPLSVFRSQEPADRWQCPSCGQMTFGEEPPITCTHCKKPVAWKAV